MEPAIRELGFEGKYPHFKRHNIGEIHFIEIWTEKYGGGFSYSLGWCKDQPLTHWDGKIIPEAEIGLIHLPFENRASACHMIDQWALDGAKLRCSDGLFEYALILEDEAECRALVERATATLDEGDIWLKTRERSDAIWVTGQAPPTGKSSELSAQMLLNQNELRVRALGLID